MLLSACATVPDSGAVQTGKDSSVGQQYLLQPVTVGPSSKWSAHEVVDGFLEALSSYAHGYATAKQYLTKLLDHNKCVPSTWNPDPGWQVAVTKTPVVKPIPISPQVQGGTSGATNAIFTVTAPQVATLSNAGQYQPSPGSWKWTATLHKCGGVWRITDPPTDVWPPLSQANFRRVYLPRNLYFLAPSSLDAIHPALVPDPIFVPLQATSVEVAETLVKSLLHNPQGWLGNTAVVTALAGARLLGRVTINAGTATVNLGGSASESGASRKQILAQLVSTLASPSYGQPAIAQSVELEIDGHPQQLATWSGGQPQQNGTSLLTVPQPGPGQPLYTLAGRNVIQRMSALYGDKLSGARIPVQTGSARTALTSIAVSPGGQYVAGLADSGRAVYYGPLRAGAKLAKWAEHGPFTGLSWDSNGNLWVVGTNSVEMLHPSRRSFTLTGLPAGSVVQMQVAPDGVRAALVVNGPRGNQIEVCALNYAVSPNGGLAGVSLGRPVVIGSDVTDPTQLAWYDSNDLIALAQPPSGPVVREVPVNGDASVGLIPDQGLQSITSAGPANPLAAGLTQGRVALTQSLASSPVIYKDVGTSPTYPASG